MTYRVRPDVILEPLKFWIASGADVWVSRSRWLDYALRSSKASEVEGDPRSGLYQKTVISSATSVTHDAVACSAIYSALAFCGVYHSVSSALVLRLRDTIWRYDESRSEEDSCDQAASATSPIPSL